MDGTCFLAMFAKYGDAESFMTEILDDYPPHSRVVRIGRDININGPDGSIVATLRCYDLSKLGVDPELAYKAGLDFAPRSN